jgi:hypothetical protein
MIAIIRKDFHDALVDEHVLDCMIATEKLIAFSRTDEWVVVGRDAVREQHTFYTGKERRRIVYGDDFCMR